MKNYDNRLTKREYPFISPLIKGAENVSTNVFEFVYNGNGMRVKKILVVTAQGKCPLNCTAKCLLHCIS